MDVSAKVRAIAVGVTQKHRPSDPSFQVVAECYVTSHGPLQGSTLMWYGSLKGGAIPITDKALRAMGFSKPISDVAYISASDVRGVFRLSVDTDPDTRRTKVLGVYPLDRDLGPGLSEHDKASLASLLTYYGSGDFSPGTREPGEDDEL